MAADGGRRGRAGFAVALVVGLVVVAWAAGRPPTDGDPLDPRSSGELGARGTVLFLEELGVDVAISDSGPGDGADVALLLEDRLTESAREDTFAWVGRGGTLVVADPSSPLAAVPAEDGLGVFETLAGDVGRGTCDLAALDGADDLDVPGAVLYEVPGGAQSCFGDGDGAYVVSVPVERGRVISVGSPTPFVNDQLDERDHAVLVAGLLVPTSDVQVVVLERPPPGGGDESLSDLVSDGVKAALLQLAVAFLVYALYRARRLGRPVAEPMPVQIAGSELVVAVGELMQQQRDPTRAAGVVQQDTARRLARRLGLPVNAEAAVVAEAVAGRGGPSADVVLDLLTRAPVVDERALVELTRSLDALRQEILHGQSV